MTGDLPSTSEFDIQSSLGLMLADFLQRLGRNVEQLPDDRIVARHRTALLDEERKFKVVQSSGDRLLKTATNVLAPGVAFPDDPEDYPQTFYFDEFLDRTVQADRIANLIHEDPEIQKQRKYFIPQR